MSVTLILLFYNSTWSSVEMAFIGANTAQLEGNGRVVSMLSRLTAEDETDQFLNLWY